MGEHTARKPHGHTVEIGPWGEIVTHDFLTCCHCKKVWEVVRGSGRVRGWCGPCGAPTCSFACAVNCIPFEQRLTNIEAGRIETAERPVKILVPSLPPLFAGTLPVG